MIPVSMLLESAQRMSEWVCRDLTSEPARTEGVVEVVVADDNGGPPQPNSDGLARSPLDRLVRDDGPPPVQDTSVPRGPIIIERPPDRPRWPRA
jgi:hypothetical protein